MRLNEIGSIIDDSWQWLQYRYDYVEIAEYVIMPNHFHGIIVISNGSDNSCRGGSRTARIKNPTVNNTVNNTSANGSTNIGPTIPKPVGQLIGAFKTVSTKHINQIRKTSGLPIWQRNYYEHIIRNETEYLQIAAYIIDNPSNWENDNYYSSGDKGGSRTAPTKPAVG